MIMTGVLQRPRAGRRAEREYKRLRAEWRRRVWWKFALVSWPLIAAGFVLAMTPVPGQVKFWGGMLAGAGITLWVALYDSPPSRVEKWSQGAEGERRTEEVLRPLEREGWRVKHDLRHGRYNIDHVVIGPGGVFLIDSKNYDGDVTVHGDDLRVAPSDFVGKPWTDRARGRKTRGQAVAMSNHLRRSTGAAAWVQATVVLWSPVEGRVVEGNRITFIQGTELVAWLRSQPRRLTPERVDAIANELRAD